MADATRVPAVEGWFTTGEDGGAPALLGSRCDGVRDLRLPGRGALLPQSRLRLDHLRDASSCRGAAASGPTPTPATSRRRRTWRPTPTCPSAWPPWSWRPRSWSSWARWCAGVTVDDLTVGDEVELVVDTLYSEDGRDYLVWKWRPLGAAAVTGLGRVGAAMTRCPGRRTTRRWRCSVPACTSGASGGGPSSSTGWRRPATRWPTPASAGGTCSSSRGPTPSATATPASCPGRPSPRRWAGPAARVSSVYAACASGAVAIANARAQILAGLCDVALVVGADTTPKGFFAPVGGGERKDDPDWLRFHLMGATNPTYFALYAAPAHGPLRRDRGGLRTGQGQERAPRAWPTPTRATARRSPSTRCWRRPWWPTRCASSRSAPPPTAARRWCSRPWSSPAATPAARTPLVTVDAVSTVTPTFPNTVIEMPNFSTDSAAAIAGSDAAVRAAAGFRPSIATAAYAEAGIGPEDVDLAEVYDLSSALELDWYEDIGLCGEGEAEKLLRDGATALGGRVPVNPSGGLSCFGEAIPAQAIAQVCECVWQLRGTASGHQVEGARVAVTANQGLFGHGSSVLLSR